MTLREIDERVFVDKDIPFEDPRLPAQTTENEAFLDTFYSKRSFPRDLAILLAELKREGKINTEYALRLLAHDIRARKAGRLRYSTIIELREQDALIAYDLAKGNFHYIDEDSGTSLIDQWGDGP